MGADYGFSQRFAGETTPDCIHDFETVTEIFACPGATRSVSLREGTGVGRSRDSRVQACCRLNVPVLFFSMPSHWNDASPISRASVEARFRGDDVSGALAAGHVLGEWVCHPVVSPHEEPGLEAAARNVRKSRVQRLGKPSAPCATA